MEWWKGSGPPGNASALVMIPPAMSDVKVGDNVAAPACLSFGALPLSSPASSSPECGGSCLDSSPARLLVASALQVRVSGASYDLFCSCSLPSPMDSLLLLLPLSTSSSSLSFPAHLATHLCTTAASAGCISSALISPSFPRWRRRKSELCVSTSEKFLRISSLASLASSLPSFSPAEQAFGGGGVKEDDKVCRANRQGQDAGDNRVPLVRNIMAGNARLRKEVAKFFQQLPSEFRGIQNQNFGRTAKRKDSDGFQVTPGPSNEKRAKTISERREEAMQTSKHLLAGAVAAMVSRTIVAPLERLKLEYLVRGATDNVIGTLRTIFLAEGVKGFWKGNGVNLLRTAPFKSINFFAYDTYRSQLLKWGDRAEVTNIERLAAGAAAGITATLMCFPLDTVRTLMVAPGGEALGGLRGCFQHLMQTEGFLGLYKGLLPAVVSMAPSGAVFYGVYDMLKAAYLNSPEGKEMTRQRRRRAEERPEEVSSQLELGPLRTLLYGALAGACAETVTYPFEVVRRAQQMQDAAHKLGMVGTMQGLLTKGGVGAFYRGLLPSTMQVLPSAALTYFVYESVKIAFKIT